MTTDKQHALERMAGETLAQNERIATLLNALTRLRATLRDALLMIESTPRPSAGLVSNHVQAAWDKRVAAIHAALDE